jgi:hypothetical protein
MGGTVNAEGVALFNLGAAVAGGTDFGSVIREHTGFGLFLLAASTHTRGRPREASRVGQASPGRPVSS